MKKGIPHDRSGREISEEKEKKTREVLHRFNILFGKRAFADLEKLATDSGTSKAQIVKRGFKLYKLISQELDAGSQIIIRDKDGKEGILHILF